MNHVAAMYVAYFTRHWQPKLQLYSTRRAIFIVPRRSLIPLLKQCIVHSRPLIMFHR